MKELTNLHSSPHSFLTLAVPPHEVEAVNLNSNIMKIVHANFTQQEDNQGNSILMGKATFAGFAGSNKLSNSKGTEYRLANVSFIGADGQTYQTSGAIYDKVMDRNDFSEGDVVSITAREHNGQMYISILGATGAGTLSATSGAFGNLLAVEAGEEVEASA